ncbi:adenylyltransferase [Xylariaceae sp. FL1272]|nr:adenylyltransferase [Xylariaceae sp. FL1272]
MDTAIQQLKEHIAKTEVELQRLKAQLAQYESSPRASPAAPQAHPSTTPDPEWKWPLKEEEYNRYGRQLILPSIGIKGQLRLKAAAVLIVGAGGLGCPAAVYLAGAGVGILGVVDGDTVEVSNLHRQIAHSTACVGMKKVDSLGGYCRGLNPEITYVSHPEHLTPQNAEHVVSGYDVVLDCTDHPTSRYLISDICVLLRKPLVSASALRTDGQLIVLNNPPAARGLAEGGPCYRCIYPRPPPADSVVSCGEGGILGPVVGVMGVLQALEAIELISAGIGNDNAAIRKEPVAPSLLLFSANSTTTFRSIRMRGRRPDCFACSAQSTLTLKQLGSGSLDYIQFCGVNTPINVLRPAERITPTEYNTLAADDRGLLLDVREKELFDIGSIPGAVNLPFSAFQSNSRANPPDQVPQLDWLPDEAQSNKPIHVICRVGNDSQLVTEKLKQLGLDRGGARQIRDIKGGMQAWKLEVDQTIPFL